MQIIDLYNLNYTPTILGVKSWREVTSGAREQETVEYHWSRPTELAKCIQQEMKQRTVGPSVTFS
jgi:hypothetical protein